MERNQIMLDTSAYSAFLRGNQQIKLSLQHADEIFLNPIILGEILTGFIMGKKERKNRTILQEFLSSPRVKIVSIDEETSERYGAITGYLLKEGTPIPTNDLWIAASAMQYGFKLLTTDKHYVKVPQIIAEYFQAS
jgi:predicted nucleic acid-binding protein